MKMVKILQEAVEGLAPADRQEFFEHVLRCLMYRGHSADSLAMATVLVELNKAADVLNRNGLEVPEYT
jgi:hypothetical protein